MGRDLRQQLRRQSRPRRDLGALLLIATVGGMLVVSIALALWLYWGDVGAPFAATPLEELATPDNALQSRDAEDAVVRAERGIGDGGIITLDIERFRIGMRRYPRSIDELTECPTDLDETQRWDGPYVNNPNLLIDPWGNRYAYEAPGVHNTDSFDLWSPGPDGISGTEDDIGNW